MVDAIKWMGQLGYKSIEVKVIPWTWAKVTQILFFSETSESFETKFQIKAHGRKKMKMNSNKYGHLTKMAAMTIYGKSLSKILFSGTSRPICYFSLGTPAHHHLFNNDPRLAVTYHKFDHLCFCKEKWLSTGPVDAKLPIEQGFINCKTSIGHFGSALTYRRLYHPNPFHFPTHRTWSTRFSAT